MIQSESIHIKDNVIFMYLNTKLISEFRLNTFFSGSYTNTFFFKMDWKQTDHWCQDIKLEQLEHLRSEITPLPHDYPTLVIHFISQVKTRQSQSYKI